MKFPGVSRWFSISCKAVSFPAVQRHLSSISSEKPTGQRTQSFFRMSEISPFSSTIPLFLFLLLLSSSLYVNSQTENDERAILLKLNQHWNYPPPLKSWNSSSKSHCDWNDISCANGLVVAILLHEKNITGAIPPFICDLRNLLFIDLSSNNISGGFPTVLYNCSKLESLNLSQNLFVGRISDHVYRISRLSYLNLDGNNFTGDIPAGICRLSELKFLSLVQNEFNGSFPPEIGNLSNLKELHMAYNDKFTPARLPSDFGRLKKLKFLLMQQTNLIGEIPEVIGNLTSLERLDLSENSLSGNIPPGLFLLRNLTNLFLNENKLTGEIPRTIQALNLTLLDLSSNNLTGTIPEDFRKLENLKDMFARDNRLSGEIPASIGRIRSLERVRLFNNSLTGVLPPDLGRYSNLEELQVSNNQLSGDLPRDLCAGGVLIGVVAFSNNLSGELPKSLGNCSSLTTVQLYNNSFSGEVPAGIWSALNLSSVMISHNLFSGELPRNFAWNLNWLEISDNKFSGEIPIELATSNNLMVFIASDNLFSGKIPVELTALPGLLRLYLDGNQLSGHLPSTIISWKKLVTLNLSRNQLSGQIPGALGSLPDLINVDLSENQLSGQVPPELGRLRLTNLNLSSNQLSGRIPVEFEDLARAYDSSFLNNSALCADNPTLKLAPCSLSRTRDSRKLSSGVLAMILAFSAIVFVVAALFTLFTLFVIREHRRKRHDKDLATWKLTSFQRLEFTESNILSGLAENNLVGSGGSGKVYRVPINRSGEAVAVKRIWSNRKLDHKLEKEFLAEVRILGGVRHSNIVKLLCCISSENSKLLVYEFMENRSLDRWLHGKKRRSSVPSLVHHAVLDWPTRLQIAIGAAQGLCYMHHDCSPPIIHRDVKSSNILLDSEFKARIADFGLARMLAKQGEADTMSAVEGSFGYFPPEYAYTIRVNEKIDVYSFGVVILELATGREAHDGDEHSSLAEWAWRQFQEGKSFDDVLDQQIKEPCYLSEMGAVFKLGLICTRTSPSSRPSMKEVLQILHRYCPQQGQGAKSEREYDVAPLLSNSTTYLSSYKKRGESRAGVKGMDYGFTATV